MNDAAAAPNTSQDSRLRERAARVIPGGMWGHQRASAVPAGYPQFFAGGDGATVRDVDGRDYIDFMCSWGPIILGHRHPEVDAVVRAQMEAGDCLNGPTEHAVRLAETLVRMIPHADWALMQKNGSDAMTTCVTLARAGTGRRKILVASGAYHGAVPWSSPSLLGVTAEDRAHLLHYTYNDAESLAAAAEAAGGDLAGIIVSAFRHDVGTPQEMPTAAFATTARALCDAAGAALIVDDVRAGFRLNLGGSWEEVGVRPDLAGYSKAIANGQPLAAVTGNDRFRPAAADAFFTGSFWYSGAPMAAAVKVLDILERENAPARLQAAGARFAEGFVAAGARHGLEVSLSGPPAMPEMHFADDRDHALAETFCLEALRRGVYLHHRHNMFLSLAHSDAVVDRAVDAMDDAFAALARSRPTST
ncbi:Aminopentol aminotransferase [Pseudooceanicola marinus]|uniref:Aminopentol aminotransferase n=1 Tax=Pseudooceanicola marinus TaxID=396013 RepID=A0A1X6YHV6_9RHOB|nr:aminotransferase class III-fold pyridoxal phosphate-dependent enzyme [Pseudooceanicola marinus]PJE26472.1 glutamate-1-semialdehyde 2,1-aminomutase [Pseudooceanicola marinus]SLN21115.1 Aminopentol aminotransferase [Pseudooceanicola marinus]